MGTKMTHAARAELTNVVRKRYCAAAGAAKRKSLDELQCLEARPDQTARELLTEFQARHPGFYKASHLRTLRRRVQVWRRQAIQRLISKMQDHTQDVGSGATA
jgi:hypothetical protein